MGTKRTKKTKAVDAIPPPPTRSKAWSPRVDRQQLASLMGVHPDTVTDYTRAGMPVVTRGGRGATSAYDAVECLAWHREQMGKNAKDNAQTRLFQLQGDLKSLELALEQGRLLPREDVVRQMHAFGKGLQGMIRALPRRLVQAGAVEPGREAAAAEVVREVLTEISRWQSERDLPKGPKAP